MKLIVGLGNPGSEYRGTRHNFGFASVDQYADKYGSGWQEKAKFTALTSELRGSLEKVILAKPLTFYNLVGESIQKIKSFYKIDNLDILVIHDEMALPLGTVRTRLGGSDAGNNGIKNIISNIGSDFYRIRIGSGLKPSHDGDAQPTRDRRDYVLGRLDETDGREFNIELGEINHIIDKFIAGSFDETTYKI